MLENINCCDVNRRDIDGLKTLLNPLFFVPPDAKIIAFYNYQAGQIRPAVLFAKKDSDSRQLKLFNVLENGKSINNVIQVISAVIENTIKLPIRALNEVQPTDKKTSEQYVIDDVCHRFLTVTVNSSVKFLIMDVIGAALKQRSKI